MIQNSNTPFTHIPLPCRHSLWHYIDSLHCSSVHPEVHLGTSYVVPVVDLFTLSGPLGPSFWSLQQPKFSIMATLKYGPGIIFIQF